MSGDERPRDAANRADLGIALQRLRGGGEGTGGLYWQNQAAESPERNMVARSAPLQPHSRGGRSHSIPLRDHARTDRLVLGFRGVHLSGRDPRDPLPAGNPFCVLVGKTWIALLSPTGLPVADWMNLLAAASSAEASRDDAMHANTRGDGDP